MTTLQALFIALLQGITELFPVSSLGHAVLLPPLLGWNFDLKSPDFLPFLVVLHLGTATALLLYFWRDWWRFAQAFLNYRDASRQADRRLLLLLGIATLPAVIIGALFEHAIRGLFAAPLLVAAALFVNGFIMFGGERLKHAGHKSLNQLGWKAAVAIGTCQALALFPGISRSGVTLVGGVMAGLYHRDSARFSFLLATPIIAGAGVHEVPKMIHSGSGIGGLAVLSGLVAGTAAWLSVAALMRYFKKHEIDALMPFAWYCWAAGGLSFLLLL